MPVGTLLLYFRFRNRFFTELSFEFPFEQFAGGGLGKIADCYKLSGHLERWQAFIQELLKGCRIYLASLLRDDECRYLFTELLVRQPYDGAFLDLRTGVTGPAPPPWGKPALRR